MPKAPQGAHGRAPQRSTSKPTRAGGQSPKHRGWKPAEADGPAPRAGAPRAGAPRAGAPKKNRWNADERAARGHSAERPRGGSDRRDDRTTDRAVDGRPNWEPRAKPARDFGRPSRDDRPARSDRPERGRSTSERPYQERPYSDRSDRSERSDRPARTWNDRPARTERPARDDRPARSFGDRDERPRYDRPARDDRPARSFADRPQRKDRPRYDRAARDDRPARSFGNREDRPRYDRPARSDDRPRASFQRDERPAGSFSGPTDDVVLERLQADAIQADEVDGVTFADLGLGANIVRELSDLGATAPFAIQAATIPDVLAGRDVLGRGRTGSGKTIAFGAPLVERLLTLRAELTPNERRQPGRAPQALILAPTRELALQIDRTVQPIARSVGLFTTQVYGGVPYARQVGALQRGVDIVIGTPGRIGDLVSQGRLDLSQIVVTVLDEADHMCDLGFLEPVQDLLRRMPDDSQKLLFSATLDSGVATLVDEFLTDPSVHEVAGEDQDSSTIEHRVFLLDQRDKQDVLTELAAGPGKKLVFARTRAFAEDLADMLEDNGIRAVALHGDLNQARRTRNLERLTSGKATVLVATDVAARGIHVDDITLVIQADAPDEYKSYLHRSGRTGRAGKEGVVVTLVPFNRRRRTQDLLKRAEIEAEWTEVRPGDAAITELAERANS